jgi:hypothetical protein
MVEGSDEFRHAPGGEANWQENYMFLGWDDDRRIATYLHLAHVPARGVLDVKALVSLDGRIVSCDVEYDGDDCLAAPGLDASLDTPLEHWRLRYSGTGTEGAAGEWIAGSGDVPFGFDLDLTATVPAVDWTPLVGLVDFPERVAKTHYEQGMRLTGSVRVGDRTSEMTGLLIRDHTWGPREFDFDLGFWTPMVLDGGDYFVCGSSILLHGKWVGLLMHTGPSGTVKICTDHVARADGPLVPGRYSKGQVYGIGPDRLADRFDFDGRLTIPVHYDSLATGGKLMTDLYSRVTWGDKTGFGTFQWA